MERQTNPLKSAQKESSQTSTEREREPCKLEGILAREAMLASRPPEKKIEQNHEIRFRFSNVYGTLWISMQRERERERRTVDWLSL